MGVKQVERKTPTQGDQVPRLSEAMGPAVTAAPRKVVSEGRLYSV